jgi:hypothetical protein
MFFDEQADSFERSSGRRISGSMGNSLRNGVRAAVISLILLVSEQHSLNGLRNRRRRHIMQPIKNDPLSFLSSKFHFDALGNDQTNGQEKSKDESENLAQNVKEYEILTFHFLLSKENRFSTFASFCRSSFVLGNAKLIGFCNKVSARTKRSILSGIIWHCPLLIESSPEAVSTRMQRKRQKRRQKPPIDLLVRVRENYGIDNHTRTQHLSTNTHLIVHCRIFPVSDQNNSFLRPTQSFTRLTGFARRRNRIPRGNSTVGINGILGMLPINASSSVVDNVANP